MFVQDAMTRSVITVTPHTTLRPGGILGDVAPTILELLGVAQPPEMTRRSLLEGRIATE